MESLIEKLRQAARESFVYSDLLREAANAITELVHSCDVLDEQVTAMYGALPKWIPVTEKLPEPLEDVLVSENGFIDVAQYDEVLQKWFDNCSYEAAPSHWMPLPEPPKDGEEDVR